MKRRTCKQRCLARAKQLGVTVETGKGMWPIPLEIELLAPDGKLFKGLGLHATVTQQDPNESPEKAWKRALEDMERGLEDCTDPECDSCVPVEDES